MKDFFLILLLFFLDQISKTYIVNSMILNSSLEISSYFNIVFIYNRGFLFGYLSNLPESLLFYIHFILFLVSIYIIYKFLYVKQSTRIISLFLFAGALGNSFDRLFRNGVVDFLDFHYLDIHWPAFNLADSFILISVIVPYFWTTPTINQWLLMIGLAAVGMFAHFCLILSLNYAEASKLAPLAYFEIVNNILIGYYFFGDFPNKWLWLGLFFIVSSGIYISIREVKKLN